MLFVLVFVLFSNDLNLIALYYSLLILPIFVLTAYYQILPVYTSPAVA